MAVSKEKIKELLGSGLSNEVVATAVGVHPSYISQLMADESFASEVISKRTVTLASGAERDRSYDQLEDKLISRVHELVDNHMVHKPADILRFLMLANQAKRRSVRQQDHLTVNQQVINLNIPTVVLQKFKQNAQGEVVEVEGQTLVTMPASTLMKNLAQKSRQELTELEEKQAIQATQNTQNKGSIYDQIRRRLPPTDSS